MVAVNVSFYGLSFVAFIIIPTVFVLNENHMRTTH